MFILRSGLQRLSLEARIAIVEESLGVSKTQDNSNLSLIKATFIRLLIR